MHGTCNALMQKAETVTVSLLLPAPMIVELEAVCHENCCMLS